jgi:hypothetical protein
MNDAQAAVVRVGGEEPLAVVREGQRLAKLGVHAVARRLGHVVEGALLPTLRKVGDVHAAHDAVCGGARAVAAQRE